MIGIIDSLYVLKYNPFNFSGHIVSFYSNLGHVENNLILAPLIIPLCSHSMFKTKLQGAVFGENRRSTMWSIFDDKSKLYDLQERLDEFKIITAQSIQHCLINEWLELDTDNLTLYSQDNNSKTLETHKSAINLARLFSNHSVTEIYDLLGVTP